MSNQTRRAVFERVRKKAAEAGLAIEDDPSFLADVDRWIAGELPIAELRRNYLNLLTIREDQNWINRR